MPELILGVYCNKAYCGEGDECRMNQQNSKYDNKALLSVKERCTYLSIGETKCRELLAEPVNGFTIRIGNRLYAHKKQLDKWLEKQMVRKTD